MLSSNNADFPSNLQEWQKHFESIFGEVDSIRFGEGGGSLSKMWLHLIENSSDIARGIRKVNYGYVLDKLSRVFCWYCSFASKLQIDIDDDLVWHYFPYICPTCYNNEGPCMCGMTKEPFLQEHEKDQKDEKELEKYRERNKDKRPTTLDGYIDMFRDIYGNTSKSVSIETVYLHFNEEVGEVSRIIRNIEVGTTKNPAKKQIETMEKALKSELADVFSYIANLSYKLDYILKGIQPFYKTKLGLSKFRDNKEELTELLSVDFEELVLSKYKDGCPDCGERKCKLDCPGFLKFK